MAPKRKKREVSRRSGGVEGAGAAKHKKRKVSKSSGEDDQVVAPKKKTFFDLPPELRNDIYELTLLEGRVRIDKDLKQPALLQTCRQVRSETRKIWYLRSLFFITVLDCDARLLGKWWRHIHDPRGKEHRSMKLKVEVDGTPNWGNLMAWCREVYEGKCCSLGFQSTGPIYLQALHAALDVVVSFQMAPWNQIEKHMNVLRHTLACIDERWRDDPEDSDE